MASGNSSFPDWQDLGRAQAGSASPDADFGLFVEEGALGSADAIGYDSQCEELLPTQPVEYTEPGSMFDLVLVATR